MILPKDNAFGILRPETGEAQIDTANPGALMQSALDIIVARYEDQYAKKAEAEKIKQEQQKLNDELTNTFNSTIKYYRQRIETINNLNFHRQQRKYPYSGIHNQAGSILKNESFFTEDFLFIKVLFNTDWGSYRYIPPDLQANRAQGYWTGETPIQLLIYDPPLVPLLASVYTYVAVSGKVFLNAMPRPMYSVPPDALPRSLYLYLFYAKPRGIIQSA